MNGWGAANRCAAVGAIAGAGPATGIDHSDALPALARKRKIEPIVDLLRRYPDVASGRTRPEARRTDPRPTARTRCSAHLVLSKQAQSRMHSIGTTGSARREACHLGCRSTHSYSRRAFTALTPHVNLPCQ